MKATNGGLLLPLHLPSQTSTTPNPYLSSHQKLKFLTQQLPASKQCSHLLLKPLHLCRSNKWDSNAESVRNKNFSNIGGFEDEDEEGFDEDEDEILEQGVQVLEEFIDSIWILKVFQSYGWALPPMLLGLLITSGPKAFLMALALALGQSTFSFAIQKMWDATQNKPRRRNKTKKRQRARASRKTNSGRRGGSPWTRKRKVGYQSWVSRNGASTTKDDQKVPSYGGWDELDQGGESSTSSFESSAQASGTSSFESSAQASIEPSKIPMEKGKLSRPQVKSDTPLLLRLLIAIFPFLASWTKLL